MKSSLVSVDLNLCVCVDHVSSLVSEDLNLCVWTI